MHTRPVAPSCARSRRFPSILSAVLVLGMLSACSSDGGSGDPQPGPGPTPGKARIEAARERGAVGEPLRFRCTAEDPRGEPISYDFDWGDGSGLGTVSESVPSGTTAEVTHTFTAEGSFEARCRAIKPTGFAGAWSDPVRYTIEGVVTQPGTHALAVEVYGRGRVTSTPEGIDCPGEGCYRELPAGTRVTLQPTPETGWRFAGWTECENGAGLQDFPLERDVHCVARFAPETALFSAWQRTGARLPGAPVWSADGTMLAAIDGGLSLPAAPLRIWEAASGRVVGVIAAAPVGFTSVAWAPFGRGLAAGRSDGSIALLDLPTGRIVREWPAHTGKVRALAWSPDGARLASADDADRAVRLWSVASGEQAGAPVMAADKVRRVAWSPDGSRLALEAGAAVGTSGWLEVHALGTPGAEALWTDVTGFAWGPEGQRYALGAGSDVRVIVTATHQQEHLLQGGWGKVLLLDWSGDGRWLGVGDADGKLVVVQADSGALVADTSGTVRRYDALRFHPSKPELAAVEEFPAAVDVLTVDEPSHMVQRRELLPHAQDIGAVAWNPNSTMLASGGSEGTLRLWDSEGLELHAMSGHGGKAIASLAWGGGGTRLASGGADGRVCIWNADGTPAHEPLVHVTGAEPLLMQVHHVALSPEGFLVAAVAGSAPTYSQRGTVKIWDVGRREEVFRFTEADAWVRELRWTPDGRYLVVAYWGVSWSIWDSQTGALRFVDPGVSTFSLAAALSPDGKQLAFGGRPGLSIFDVSTGEELQHASYGFDVYALTWGPEGRRLAGGGQGGLVFVWNTSSSSLSSTVIGAHEGSVSSVSWRADGKGITTGGTDAALVTWFPSP